MTASEIIKALQSLGRTKYKISKDTGINKTTLSNWEQEKFKPMAFYREILIKYYNKVIKGN